jgi:hypothetical protein
MNKLEAEKLLRRIEVRRLFEKPEDSFSLDEIRIITTEFIQHAVQNTDWRFLNTALKLVDWLQENGYITPEIRQLEYVAFTAMRLHCGLPNS